MLGTARFSKTSCRSHVVGVGSGVVLVEYVPQMSIAEHVGFYTSANERKARATPKANDQRGADGIGFRENFQRTIESAEIRVRQCRAMKRILKKNRSRHSGGKNFIFEKQISFRNVCAWVRSD